MSDAADSGRSEKRARRLRVYAWVAILVVGLAGFFANTYKDHWWHEILNARVLYGGRPDKGSAVYAGTDGRLIVRIQSQLPERAGGHLYLIETKKHVVCSAGPAFSFTMGRFAFASDPNPCEYVLDGVIEPPSLDAKLVVSGTRLEFTAFHGERVIVDPISLPNNH